MNIVWWRAHNWLAHKINNESLEEHLHLFKGRVVDLGCGTAPYKTDILTVADEYIGVDWKNSFHDQCNVDIFASLTEPLPIEDEFADIVSSFQVMEHLPESSDFLSECFRIFKPGGNLFLTIPFMWHVHEAPHDYYRYTRHGLEYLLNKNGFSAIEVKERTGFWQMTGLKFNYYTTSFSNGIWQWLFIPLWWLVQKTTPTLDRLDPRPTETAFYSVSAKKPQVAIDDLQVAL